MIFDGLSAYSFRIDLSNNSQSTAEIKEFFEKYKVVKYYGNPEIGDKTKKPHYQMIIWMQEQNSACVTKMRNYWRGKVQTKKGGGVSLCKARNEERLFGYCRKEEKNEIFTNVSKEIYEKIKKYESLDAVKVRNEQKLRKLIGDISQKSSKKDYLYALENVYFSVYKKTCLRRNFYLQELRKAGYMSSQDIIHQIFPHGVDGRVWKKSAYDEYHNYLGEEEVIMPSVLEEEEEDAKRKKIKKICKQHCVNIKEKLLKQMSINNIVDEKIS